METFTLSRSDALALFEDARVAAEEAGAGMVLDPIELAPSPALSKAIDFSLTKAETSED